MKRFGKPKPTADDTPQSSTPTCKKHPFDPLLRKPVGNCKECWEMYAARLKKSFLRRK